MNQSRIWVGARAASGWVYLGVAEGRVEVLGKEEVHEVVDGERRPPEARGAAAVLQDTVDDLLRDLAVGPSPGGEVAAEVVGAHVGRPAGEAGEEHAHVLRRRGVAEREPAREEDAALVRPHLRRGRPRLVCRLGLALRPRRGCVGWGGARGRSSVSFGHFRAARFQGGGFGGWTDVRRGGARARNGRLVKYKAPPVDASLNEAGVHLCSPAEARPSRWRSRSLFFRHCRRSSDQMPP